jgi:hypothetical protein
VNKGRAWVRSTLKDHRRRGYETVITNDELYFLYQIAMKNYCPYCGLPFEHGEGRSGPHSPTVDVIDPHNKVLSVFNVRIICHLCNTTKSNRTHSEFIDYCKMISESWT